MSKLSIVQILHFTLRHFIFFIQLWHVCFARTKCPCSDISLCDVVSKNYDMQVFAFSMNSSNFKSYDFSRLGTIATTYTIPDPQLVCYAHSHHTRVVSMANFPVQNLTDPRSFEAWIQDVIQHIQENMLDGVNVDFESAIPKSDSSARQGFTQLIFMLTSKLKALNKNYQVSMDFAWSPDCIDSRCYDYATLAKIVDYAFVMSYDERSQFNFPCVAWANSPYNMTTAGVEQYLQLGIPANKMILGVPWYGYRYPCTTYNKQSHECGIKKVAFRGSECSDAAGREISYSAISALLQHSSTGRLWDKTARSPFFTYKDPASGELCQMWYDDVTSLKLKYSFAVDDMKLAGVGMWQADALDYTNTSQVGQMWKAMPGKTSQMDARWKPVPNKMSITTYHHNTSRHDAIRNYNPRNLS